jgi:cysteine desulfurase / selenocysteine lyase
MPPYQGGGDMILSVTFEKTIYNHIPEQIRGGNAQHRGGDCLGRAISTTSRASGWRISHPTNMRC